MRFTKQQLNFLEVFAMVSNTKAFLNDKVNIQTKDNKVYFSQNTDNVKLIQVLEVQGQTDQINVTYLTNQLSAMVKSCQDDDVISISAEGIKFGKNSEYKFESYDVSIDDPNTILNMAAAPEKSYALGNFEKINTIKNFISSDENFNCISLQDNNFISYNGQVIAISTSTNDIKELLYLPSVFFNIIDKLKIKEVNLALLQNGEYYNFKSNDLNIFLSIKEYGIPYVFSSEIKSEYDHPYSVECNKKEILKALNRIKIISQSNPETRVYVQFTNNKIIIESKDGQYGKEEVDAVYNNELKDFYVILSSSHLYSIASLLVGETVRMFLKPDKSINAVKIVYEKEENIYVHIPFEYNE